MRRAHSKKEQIWRGRIEAAKSFPGGVEAYCRKEGILSSSFYSWRRRFADEAESTSAFVPAIVAAARPVQSEPAQLADAKWVGEMLASFVRSLV